MRFIRFVLLSFAFILILILYFNNTANQTLLGIIFDAFWINFLAVFYILLIHHLYKFSLPDRFHEIRDFEKSGYFFKLIGVKEFKFLLTKNPFPIFTARLSIKSYSYEGLINLEKEMRDIEAIHFLGFLSTIIIMIPFGFFRDHRYIYFMIAFNIVENLYPMLVQRYNRNRIQKIIASSNEILI